MCWVVIARVPYLFCFVGCMLLFGFALSLVGVVYVLRLF